MALVASLARIAGLIGGRNSFNTDSLALCCVNVEIEKQWWIKIFDCQETRVPEDWDARLPSDVALRLPGADEPTILLSDRAEVERAGYERPNDHPLVFCDKLRKAREYLSKRGAKPGPIQDGGGTEFFQVPDPEGNLIEICREP